MCTEVQLTSFRNSLMALTDATKIWFLLIASAGFVGGDNNTVDASNRIQFPKCRWPSLVRIEHSCVLSCSGAIISPNWVLTSAYCAEQFSAQNLIITAGEELEETSTGTEQRVRVTKIVTHEDYRSEVPRLNDVALLHVEPEFTFLKCINASTLVQTVYEEYGSGYNAGWVPDGEGYKILVQEFQVLCEKRCRTLVGSRGKTNNTLCTDDEQGYRPLPEEYGSPLYAYLPGNFTAKMLLGIFSWSDYSVAAFPAVYTSIAAFSDWISNKTSSS